MAFSVLFSVVLCFVLSVVCDAADPSTRVVLPQGLLTGLRLQTEGRVVVTAYLGIPYALPPLGSYRFAPPERHPGWNESLSAEHFRPDCLQPNAEATTTRTSSEDCLYLNVFVPETGTVVDFPVVVFLQGQDFVTGSPRAVSAQELAAEGLIVVTVSYRLNVFGFLCFGDSGGRGNLGLLDQYLALLWVHENILHFGGKGEITLMGHGAGAAAVAAHLASPRTRGLLSRAIMMSGSAFSPLQRPETVVQASRAIARSLGCLLDQPPLAPLPDSSVPLNCLRQKSADQILLAFENSHKNANWTSLLVPVADNFLPERMRYLPEDPTSALRSGRYSQVPILTGTTANEGTVLLERWKELGSQTETGILHLMERSAIPFMLGARGLSGEQSSAIVQWRYLESTPGPRLAQLLQLYGDAAIVAPHWQQVGFVSADRPVFVYRFSLTDPADLTAGGHGSDLPLLFGPLRRGRDTWSQGSQQAAFGVERLSLRMKRLWTTFIRTGDPNPSNSNGSRIWPPYTPETGELLELMSDPATGRTMVLRRDNPDQAAATFWNILLPAVVNVTRHETGEPLDVYNTRPGECTPYKNAMFTTLFFLILLIVCLVLALVLLKRRAAGRQKTIL